MSDENWTSRYMKRKYNADQPRDPKGTPTGGQWTSTSGWSRLEDVPKEGNYTKLDGGTRTTKNVQIGDRNYRVDLDPRYETGLVAGQRKMFAEILWWEDRPTSGPISGVMEALTGKPAFRREYFGVEGQELNNVIATLGWKFSTSKIWRDTWEFYVGDRIRKLRRNR